MDNEALCCKDGDTVGEAIDTGATAIGFLEGSLVGEQEGLFIGDKMGTLEGDRAPFIGFDGGFECGAIGDVFDTSIDGSTLGSKLGSTLGSTVGSKVSVVVD